MSHLLVSAFTSALPSDDLPTEILYIPEGEHVIFPTVNGKPEEVTVRLPRHRGPAIAAKLDAKLQSLRAGGVRPTLDFGHQRAAASALPLSFRYETGRGLMLKVEWTGAGRAAIAGKDFSFFSPEFLMGDDGEPSDIPSRGPIGGLVNQPAFRSGMQIAAADAAGDSEALAFVQAYEESVEASRRSETTPEERQAAFARLESDAAELLQAGRVSTLEDARLEAYARSESQADYLAAFG